MKNEMIHDKIEFSNMRNLVEDCAKKYGDKIAYSFKEKPASSEVTKISFERVRDDVRALASELLALGCADRHCVVIGKMSYQWALLYFSLLSIGAVLVPLDRDWTAEDLADTSEKADASFLFCDADICEKADVIKNRCNLKSAPFFMGESAEESDSVLALIEKGRTRFENDPSAYFGAKVDTYAMSLLVFTSGTTGKGKGVMLSQNAVLSDMAAIIPYMDFAEKTVGVLPPHHTYGSSVMLVGHMMIGGEVYISAGLRYIQRELKEQKPGHLVLVPLYLETFYRKILANAKESGKDKMLFNMIKVSNALRKIGIDKRREFFGAVRDAFGGEVNMIISGGAPINLEIMHFFDAIGITTINGYGITECAPIIAANHSRNVVAGSAGPIIDIDKLKLYEPNEDGEGEICVKGPNVMLGYYKDAEATADAMTEDGYFRTGDYGKLDKNGNLFITGRKKNLIILSNGKNVYPEEIESELVAVPGVLDIVVYEGQSKRGIAHNAIVAEVFPDKDYIEKNGIEDITAHLKKYVDEYNKTAVPYKKIGILKVRKTDFPKNTLRKIMRFQIDMTID